MNADSLRSRDRAARDLAGRYWAAPILTTAIAIAIATVAWLQPVSATGSDAGIALVAAQALVEHGTLDLNVYRNLDAELGPSLHYDLDADYRIERRRDGTRPYMGIGVPVLTAPIVALARLLGFDMLDPAHEAALQNLLSALACGVVYLLLVQLGRCFLPLGPSLALAAVFQLASPLTSTLATALWNLDLSIPLMLVVLIALIRYEQGARAVPWVTLGLVLPLALLSRPTTAFLILGLCVFMLLRAGMAPRMIGLLGLLAVAFLIWLDSAPVVLAPVYYAPQRLLGIMPLHMGLPAILLSPSRGLLVFCPFLLPLMVAAWRQRRFLVGSRIAILCAVWIATQMLAVATKGRWWGGHSFGPRLLTELLLPAFLVAAMLLTRSFAGRRALVWTGLALAVPSIAVHSGQGLFNEATKRWNEWPSIDQAPALLYSWRYPQFLASERQLVARELYWQRARLEPLALGQQAGPRDVAAVFEGWWVPEAQWRWSRDPRPRICFRTQGFEPDRWYALRMDLGAFGRQIVTLELDGKSLGRATIEGFEPTVMRWPVAGQVLVKSSLHCLTTIPSAPRRASSEDPRLLAISFRSLRFDLLPDRPTITWQDDAAFAHGWSIPETSLRWSDGHHARLMIATRGLDPADRHQLELSAFAAGEQTVHARLSDGTVLGTTRVSAVPGRYSWPLPPGVVADTEVLIIDLELPDARRPGPADRRQLGLALEQVSLVPMDTANAETEPPSTSAPS